MLHACICIYSIQITSTNSSSGTPSAIKKPTANQRGLFDDDEDDDVDEVFRTSKSTRLESKSSSAKTSEPSEVTRMHSVCCLVGSGSVYPS